MDLLSKSASQRPNHPALLFQGNAISYGELERRRFRQDAALRPFSITADRNQRFGAMLKRKLSDRFDLSLDAQRDKRRTDTDVAEYSGTQVTLGAAIRF